MVATVGSISIDLSTNTAKFTQGFKASASTVERESARMSKAVNGFGKASKAASSVVSGFVGGIVAGGALAAIGSLTGALSKARQSLSDFEEIGNRAKATGLGTDTFQAISHGASLADVEQESLNKSLEIFAKNVGLAKDGSGALYSSMIKLNPVLLQQILNAKDQETRLKLVADAMARMTDATDKAALATAVFGRGGAEMVRVLDKGSASIEEMKRNAQDLGIIIPDDLIQKAGELDDKLSTLEKVIDVNISQALVKAAPLLVAGAEGMVKLAKGANDLSTAIERFASNKSLATFMDLLKAMGIEPEITGGLAGAIRDMVAETKQSFDELQKEITDTEIALADLYEKKREGFPVDDDILKTAGHLDYLNSKLRETNELFEINQKRSALASQFRAAENASMAGVSSGRLPTVHYPAGQSSTFADPDVMDDVERAIEKETEATNRVAARATDVYRGVQQFDTHSAGYFDRLGSQIDGGLRALSYSVREGSGYATGAAATSAKFSGGASFGGNTSWAGRSMTFAGPSEEDQAYYNSVFGGRKYRVGGTEDASSITSGGTTSGAVNVNVVVKPVMEGSRLSGQSTSEIKQAASAGANAALRAYYGR